MQASNKMAGLESPFSDRGKDTRSRLERCWQVDLNWELFPTVLKALHRKTAEKSRLETGPEKAIIEWSGQSTLSITRAACDFKGGLGACSPWKIFEFHPSEMASGKF